MPKLMTCPICGDKFRNIKEHYLKHQGELTFNEFFAKLYGYPEVPKCPYCGDECSLDWSSKRFGKTCENKECRKKHGQMKISELGSMRLELKAGKILKSGGKD